MSPRDEAQKPPHDGEIHPMRFALFCKSHDTPQPVEISARLARAGFGAEEVSGEVEASGEDVIWSRTFRLQSGRPPWLVFVVRRDKDFAPWEWSECEWPAKDDFDATRNSRWLLYIETLAEPGRPGQSYHLMLRVADALGDGLAGACLDAQSMVLRSADKLAQLARCDVDPAPEELFITHTVLEKEHDLCWLHTHGLRRFGLPDLEMLAVPTDMVHEAEEAIAWLAGFIMPQSVPNAGEDVTFGMEVHARLAPVDGVVNALAPGQPGGPQDRDDEHAGWRMAVLDPTPSSDLAPLQLLKKMAQDPVLWLTDEESARRSRLARARFGHAAAAYLSASDQRKSFIVKVAVPADDEGTDFSAMLANDKVPADLSCEHMWFEVTAIERGGTFSGVLHNDPVMVRFMERGCEYTLPVSQISGFHLIVGDRRYGPESIGELDARI